MSKLYYAVFAVNKDYPHILTFKSTFKNLDECYCYVFNDFRNCFREECIYHEDIPIIKLTDNQKIELDGIIQLIKDKVVRDFYFDKYEYHIGTEQELLKYYNQYKKYLK
jgi:hypothetical protein